MAKLRPVPRDLTGEPFPATLLNGGHWTKPPWFDPTEPVPDGQNDDAWLLFTARKRFFAAQAAELRKLTQCPERISDMQFLNAHGFTLADRGKPQTAHLKLNGGR